MENRTTWFFGKGMWTVSVTPQRWSGKVDSRRQDNWLIIRDKRTRGVLQRLESLLEDIRQEIEEYEAAAVRAGEGERRLAAEMGRAWVDGTGMLLMGELREQIERADPATLREMLESIDAASELRQIARRRDLERWDNRDLLLDWCMETLPSLKRAFHDLKGDSARFSLHPPALTLLVAQWNRDGDTAYSAPPAPEAKQTQMVAA